MASAVPDVINRYLQAAAAADNDALTSCFADDGAVTDEGRTYQGKAEIRAWREKLSTSFEYTVEVLRSESLDDNSYLVTTKVEGNFPGSPVELGFAFTLSDDLIDELVIAP